MLEAVKTKKYFLNVYVFNYEEPGRGEVSTLGLD